VIDWLSRYVVTWQLSSTVEGLFCRVALRQALQQSTPAIFNTDQGAQFTAVEFTGILETARIPMTMDGRGRTLDNIFVERLWRTIKYENIYLVDYASVPQLEVGLHAYFHFYNHERPHQRLGYRTPAEVHRW
jgi:putative transposase